MFFTLNRTQNIPDELCYLSMQRPGLSGGALHLRVLESRDPLVQWL